MSVGHNIAEYVLENDFDSFPSDVVEKAKICILDTIGVAIYGTRFKAAQILLSFAKESGGKEEATVLGSEVKVPAALAAFANGVAAHVADFDDDMFIFQGHPSCVLTPAVLALCEMLETDGKTMLNGFLVGIEIGGKLGKVMTWSHYGAGWHGTATIGTIAAAAAAAKILNLSKEQITNTLAIAASSAAGLTKNFGTMTKSLHAGQAARNGIIAAQLAKKGFTASSDIFEAPSGFFNTFKGTGNADTIRKELGEPYALNGIIIKKYPCCLGVHAAVDAILDLKRIEGFESDDVEEIICKAPTRDIYVLMCPNPKNELEAKFSMQFCVSAALVNGKLGIAEFDDKIINSPQVQETMKKVKMMPDDELDRLTSLKNLITTSELTVKLRNGKKYVKKVLEARGGPSNPLQRSEIEAKFLECASVSLPRSKSKDALEMLWRLEALEKISDLKIALES
jgi:2-methylcitrate dehydratase PrpD